VRGLCFEGFGIVRFALGRLSIVQLAPEVVDFRWRLRQPLCDREQRLQGAQSGSDLAPVSQQLSFSVEQILRALLNVRLRSQPLLLVQAWIVWNTKPEHRTIDQVIPEIAGDL
jgi:hypothetical protein